MPTRKFQQYGLSRWLFPVAGVIWFCGAFFAISWVGEGKFKEFDPNLRLSSEMMSLSMEDELMSLLSFNDRLKAIDTEGYEGSIFHITQGSCFCETLSEGHQNSLNEWAAAKNIAFQTIQLSNEPALSRFVPSTPAIIVVNNNKELIYLGPYSSGMGCFQDSGLVDERIKPYFDNANEKPVVNELRATIQSEAKGCYCATKLQQPI